MGMVNCSECKKEISDKSFSCPHCGKISVRFGKMIKVVLLCSIVLVALIVLVSLFKHEDTLKMDKQVYDLGAKALDIMDMYIDVDIDSEEAREKLDNIINRLDGYSCTESLIIRSKILNFSVVMSSSSRAFSSYTYKDILKGRNSLAEYINKKSR